MPELKPGTMPTSFAPPTDPTGAARDFRRERRLALELFTLSFAALFLELMVIRWSPSVVRLVAYYGNLMLISSFLGLGIGSMLAGNAGRAGLLRYFGALVAAEVLLLVLGGN